jgi:uncharacterized membrane protein
MRYLIAYGFSAVVMLVLDGIWLTVMANRLYKPVLGDWMVQPVRWPAAVVFYLLFLFGVTFLATAPALNEGSWQRAAINGAVFGLIAYATYDLTNQATLTRWSTTLTLADMAWGTFLSTVVAVGGYFGARWLAR